MWRFCVLVLLHAVTIDSLQHTCVHDMIVKDFPPPVLSRQLYPNQDANEAHGRRLSGSGRAPIRILADTTNVLVSSNFTASQRNFLINTVLPIAIGNLSSMLLVDPVSGKLAASRSCSGGYLRSGPNVGKCVSYSTSLPVCNSLPLVTIPLSYLGNSYTGCTDYSNIPGSCTSVSGGGGVSNADFVVFVTVAQTTACPAKGEAGTLAYAADCQRDQMDRPTFGSINFCPHSVPSGVDASYQLAIHTTIHELMHAVGFSARSWPLFRGASGTPLTPRDSVFPHTPASSYSISVTCGGGSSMDTYLPGPNVITNGTGVNTRGYPCTLANDPLDCPHYMSTTKVTQAARAFFDCPTLQGAELENQDISCSLLGSHWEQRVLQNELMSPVVTAGETHISPLTLALFEDSGWYTPDYTKAFAGYRKGLVWGYKQGCSFANDKCLSASTRTSTGMPAHFDNSTTPGQGCSIDRRNKAYSDGRLATTVPSIPFRYPVGDGLRYYSSSLDQRDYCPAMGLLEGGDCTYASMPLQTGNPAGEVYGADSYCLTGTLLKNMYIQDWRMRSMCYKVNCTSASSYTVTLESATVTCSGAGSTVTVPGFTGNIICPDPALICAPPDPQYLPPWISPSATPSVSVTQSPPDSSSSTPTRTRSASVTPTTSPSISSTRSASMTASATRTAPQPQVCRLSSTFSEWTECVTTPCTASGQQSRTKALLQPPVGSLGPCSLSSWIETRVCTGNVSLPCPTCANGVADSDESDVDCGGSSACPRCEGGWYCTSHSDCAVGYECGTGHFCIALEALAYPYYVRSYVTLAGVPPAQFRGLAVSAFTATLAAHMQLQLGVAQPSPPKIFITQIVSSGASLSVHFVVVTSHLQAANYAVGGLTGDLTNANARIQAAVVAFAPLASVTLSSAVSVDDIKSAAEFALGPSPTQRPPPTPIDEEPTLIGVTTGGVVFGGLIAGIVFYIFHRKAKKAKERAQQQAAAVIAARKASIVPDPYSGQKRQSWVGTGILPAEPEHAQPRRQSVGAVNLDVAVARRQSQAGSVPVTPDAHPAIVHRTSIVQAQGFIASRKQSVAPVSVSSPTQAVDDCYSLQAQYDPSTVIVSQQRRQSIGASMNPVHTPVQHRASIVGQVAATPQQPVEARRQSVRVTPNPAQTPIQHRTSVVGPSHQRRQSVGATGGYPGEIPLQVEVATRRGTLMGPSGVPTLPNTGGYDSPSTLPFDPVPTRRE